MSIGRAMFAGTLHGNLVPGIPIREDSQRDILASP
jgi:hypothetical protein